MRSVLRTDVLVLLVLAAALLAAAPSAPAADDSARGPAREEPLSPASPEEEEGNEPEEPDFAFISGGPYTQKKNSIQIILPGQIGERRTRLGDSSHDHAEFGALLRTEWGLTDRLELDVMVPAEGARDRQGRTTLSSNFALADAILGVRYRFLRESSAPLTLAMGPQIIFPSGSTEQGTGLGSVGYAWDLAVAKDWGGPFFLYSSWNLAAYPSVRDPAPGSRRSMALRDLFWGSALGIRALEKKQGPVRHDLHAFLEYGLERDERLQSEPQRLSRASEVHMLAAPGIRYGFLTARQTLVEIGVSFPLGLNRETPRHGVIVQFQFERLFRR